MTPEKKRKWWEGILFLLVLLLAGGVSWFVLSRCDRTSHIYAYDDTLKLKKEQMADKGESPAEEETQEEGSPEEKQQQEEESDPNISSDDSPDKKKSEHSDKKTEGDDPAKDSRTGDDGSGNDKGKGNGDGNGGETPGPAQETTRPTDVDSTEIPPDAPSDQPVDPQEDRPLESVRPTVKPTAKPTAKPDAHPTKAPDPEKTADPDKVILLTCTWKEKDSLIYGKAIPKDSMVVKAKMSSGKEKTLSASEYIISGLKNDSIGQHIMTIAYGGAVCRLRYTVNNHIDHLELDWDEKDRLCVGEDVTRSDVNVTAHMADDTEYDLEDDQFTMTKIDTRKEGTGSFTITYQEFTIKGTYTVRQAYVTYINKYYDGDKLIGTEQKKDKIESPDEEFNWILKDLETYKGKDYVLENVGVVADGKEKQVKGEKYTANRVFDLQITYIYKRN